MISDKPMMPLSPAVARVLGEVRSQYGQKVRDDLRECVDIERRLDWLNEHEPLVIVPSMSSAEINAAIDSDPNVVERRALASRKEELFSKLPTGAVAMYRFPDTPTLILR